MSTADLENDFNKSLDKVYEEKAPDFGKHVNIALVGKVSAGKSSLLNAILMCTREKPIAKVGAQSGVTTRITPYKLDDNVLIVDCPGLDDVRKENSAETKAFLESIDLGIFVVTGSADASQKTNFDDLKNHSRKVLVVLNKIDEWDDLEESACQEVMQQWKAVLGVDKIFGTCAKGYDPQMRKDAPMTLKGIDELRTEIFDFLEKEGKNLLLAKHLQNKSDYAIKIILGALALVAGEAFIPGSAVYITATQAISITALYYLYTGKALSKSSALAILPTFIARTAGTNLFLWVKSFLPPTGVLDTAAAVIAVGITFAMLAAVRQALEKGYDLSQSDKLQEAFNHFRQIGKNISLEDVKDRKKAASLLKRLLGAP